MREKLDAREGPLREQALWKAYHDDAPEEAPPRGSRTLPAARRSLMPASMAIASGASRRFETGGFQAVTQPGVRQKPFPERVETDLDAFYGFGSFVVAGDDVAAP